MSEQYPFEALARRGALADAAQVLVLLVDVQLVVDVRDLQQLASGRHTRFRCCAGMFGMPAFCGELHPIL